MFWFKNNDVMLKIKGFLIYLVGAELCDLLCIGVASFCPPNSRILMDFKIHEKQGTDGDVGVSSPPPARRRCCHIPPPDRSRSGYLIPHKRQTRVIYCARRRAKIRD